MMKRFCDFCEGEIRANQATYMLVLSTSKGTVSDYVKSYSSEEVCQKCADRIQRTIWNCGVKSVDEVSA